MNGILSCGKPTLGFFFFIYCCCSLLSVALTDCDKSQCKGPIKYYEDLKCKPVYEKEDDCCAVRYDCSHLSSRTTDKCYANGKEYNIGDNLALEDRSSPCDISCFCAKGYNNVASFQCAAVDCFAPRPKEGCYRKSDLDSCCGLEEVCPKSNETIVTCEYNGEIYKEGQLFYPTGLRCLCSKDYKGENIEPFCRKMSCGTELRHSLEVRENCSPVFYTSFQSPSTSCNFEYRCQNYNDTVVRSANVKSSTETEELSDDMKCKFGNMTMRIGDELSQSVDNSCVECKCEVPPIPTCKKSSGDICYGKTEQTTIPVSQ